MKDEAAPLLEEGPTTDFFADDIDHIEVVGQYVRLIYWRWKLDGETWQRVALSCAIIMPRSAAKLLIKHAPDVRVMKPPVPGLLH